ncbi:MAG: SIMPL domain-containing protein [Anaerolineae bacterium]
MRKIGWIAMGAIAAVAAIVIAWLGQGRQAGTFEPAVAAAATTTAASAAATPAAASVASALRTVQVVGRGEVSVKPDMAEITVGVQSIAPTLAAASQKANTDMDAVVKSLKSSGVADKDIQTVSYNVNAQRDNNNKVTGYQVTNMVRVKVRDLSKAGATLDAAVSSGANQVYGISFTLADPAAADKAARQAAIDNAKARAGDYATQAGASVGQVLQISETMTGPTPLVQFDAAPRAAASMSAAVPVQTGELTVTAQVQVVYALQ